MIITHNVISEIQKGKKNSKKTKFKETTRTWNITGESQKKEKANCHIWFFFANYKFQVSVPKNINIKLSTHVILQFY